MKVLENGTRIKIGTVEGKTTKKGVKQNRIYTIVKNHGYAEIRGEKSDLRMFYTAIDEKGKEVTLYDVHKDLSVIGIAKKYRYSYTKDFTILQ